MHEEETPGRVVKETLGPRSVWDGAYTKQFYWLYPSDGSARVKCWPNAGLMVSVDDSGRVWKPADGVDVQLITEEAEEPSEYPLRPSIAALGLRERLEQRRKSALQRIGEKVHMQVEAKQLETNVRTIVEGKPWAKTAGLGFKRGVCKHKFGLAGGFTECSACGVKRDKACTHSFGFAGGFAACPMCKEG